ncbi:isotrichodermin C-15 hydroxylase [Chaetomium fimeti]|uniref:Isotrichodermin C-15 hydroxylase n=1 Tax=Chaetomium fimeti TaxID=1854472 RepID=A0AAE0LWT8_9PEZI|nr:isotrichodermin C-15 hydroxylase [Chaetomium fimeti]
MINLQHLTNEVTSNPALLISSVVILSWLSSTSQTNPPYSQLLTYPLTTLTYNLLFHPLRHTPGPLLSRASALPWAIRHALGTSAFHTHHLHTRYGPVVRIAPNHLSFTAPRAWRDIYGSLPRDSGSSGSGGSGGSGGKSGYTSVWPEVPKSKTFTSATDDQEESIVQADFHEHARLRRALAPGFSDAALRVQEPLLRRYVEVLVGRIGERCGGGGGGGGDGMKGEGVVMDMEKWYNWTTFDIAGDLVFGRAFGCLEREAYHPWIAFLMGTLKAAAGMVSVIYLGGRWLVRILFKTVGQKSMLALREMTEEMVSHRLAMEKGRDDLFEGLVKHREEWNLSFEKFSTNGLVLTLAGSETLATTLCGTTYLLLKNPKTIDRLSQEVRAAFSNTDEITVKAVSQLPYLTAVINESLRMYPPVAADLIRVIPPEGKNIAGHYVAGGTFVEVQPWSINHSPDNWVEPWTFNPDRFLPGEDEAKEAGNILEASQPFSWGPRNCLGRNLAYAGLRLILARIIFYFDMKLAGDSGDWIGRQKTFPLWARLPLNVHFTPVKRG